MPSVTLAESAKLAQDDFTAGIIETVVTVNQMYQLLPFEDIDGNAIKFIRENALGDVQYAGVGDAITAKAAATFTEVTAGLTTIIGDAEVNGLIQATRSSWNDQKGVQVASKLKSAARQLQDGMINGTGAANSITGLLTLVAASQTIGAGAVVANAQAGAANGAVLNFEDLDYLLTFVKDKDGQVDFLMMHERVIRKIKSLMRAAGGNSGFDLISLPDGSTILSYNGTPCLRNDWIPTTQTKGTSTDCTTIFAGNFDDGSRTKGIAGITARDAAGLRVEEVGISETKDETITRVKWYVNMVNYSQLGLAALTGVRPG